MSVTRLLGARHARALVVGLLFLGFLPKLPAPNFTWDAGPFWPGPRDSSAMSVLANGDLLLYAGRGSAAGLKDTYLFDVSSSAWAPGATIAAGPGQRFGHAMALDGAGRVVLFGGVDAGVPVGETWLFDGAWSLSPATGPQPRYGHGMSAHGTLVSGSVVLFGGFDAANRYGDTWVWDHTNDSWTALPAGLAPSPRFATAMAYDPSILTQEKVVLFGGNDGTVGLRNDTWYLDNQGIWSQGANPHPSLRPKDRHRMAYLPGTGIVLFGGFDVAPSREVWILDATGWNLDTQPVPPALTARVTPELAEAGGRLYLFGGSGPGVLDDMWVYDATTGWAALSSARPTAREGAKASWGGPGVGVLLFGGEEPSAPGSFPQDLWRFDGASWSPVGTTGTPPAGRRDHGIAYDSARSVLVLFGGDAIAGRRNDTFELQGTTWVDMGPAPLGLTQRSNFAITYDDEAAVQQVLVFGGRVGPLPADVTDEMWKYNNLGWVQSVVAGPAAREGAAFAYDGDRGVAVLFGGEDTAGSRTDTWEYALNTWTPTVATAPFAARTNAAMVYHDQANLTYLFGGWDGNTALYGDAWFYNGATWFPAPVPPQSLTPRYTTAIGYDFTNSRAVLIGGEAPSTENDVHQFGYSARDVIGGQGPGQPNPNQVRVFAETGASTPVDFFAYSAGSWGVNVDSADLANDELDEILTAPGPGEVHGPQIRAFGATGDAIAKVNFFAYGTLKFGANVAGVSVEGGDPEDEILTGAGPGAVFGPHVRAWAFTTSIAPISKVNFYAYFTLKYGVNVAGGDIEADGFEELVTAPGPGVVFGPQVRGFNYDAAGPLSQMGKVNFTAFSVGEYGARAAVGLVLADGALEIVASPGPGSSAATHPARFVGFDFNGTAVTPIPGYDVSPFPGLAYGGRPSLGNVGGIDPADELFATPGEDPNAAALLATYGWNGAVLTPTPLAVTMFGSSYGAAAAPGALGY